MQPSNAATAASLPADTSSRTRLASCAATQNALLFSATVHGEVLASIAATNTGLWRSESLGAPLVHVYGELIFSLIALRFAAHLVRPTHPRRRLLYFWWRHGVH